MVALLLALAIAFGGGDDDSLPALRPRPRAVGEGSVDADSRDEISPPGEQFCATGRAATAS